MKNIVCLFLLVFLNGHSQTLEQLKLETKKLYDAHYNMDFEGIASLYHPNYFEKIAKEELIAKLDEQFQNDRTGIRFVFPNMNFTYGTIKEIQGTSYCLISFKNTYRVNFENTLTKEEINKNLSFYQANPKIKSVKFEDKRNSFYIEENIQWIAVSSNLTTMKWKFVEQNSNLLSFDELVAPAVQKDLGL
ncbi:hypothetical protein [Flavobacterium sp.]|uniref:hypothetical protein n=1 Tax=Flavobacterium sp. TaxID=239 RepID=UPI003526DE4E